MLVLDTHVLIWLMSGNPTLGFAAREEIEEAARADRTLVPAVVFWEIAMLVAKNRIALGAAVEIWVDEVVSKPGLAVSPLTPEIAIHAYDLPGSFQDDPADRMIVASARVLGATLVTRDRDILRYGAEGHVDVLAA